MLIVMKIHIIFHYFLCLPQRTCVYMWWQHIELSKPPKYFYTCSLIWASQVLWGRSVIDISVIGERKGGDRHTAQAPRMLPVVRLLHVYGQWQSQGNGRWISSALTKGEWFRAKSGFLPQSGSLNWDLVLFLQDSEAGGTVWFWDWRVSLIFSSGTA